MKNVIGSKSALHGNLFLIEETLTDDSHVYNISMENKEGQSLATWYCTDEDEALSLFHTMGRSYFEIHATPKVENENYRMTALAANGQSLMTLLIPDASDQKAIKAAFLKEFNKNPSRQGLLEHWRKGNFHIYNRNTNNYFTLR